MSCLSFSLSTWNAAVALRVNCWPWWWRWLTTPSFQCNNTKTSLRIWYQTYRACTHPLGSLLISSPYSQPLLPSITQWYGICPRTCYWAWSHIRCRGTPISLKYFLIACKILIPIFPSIGNTKMCPNSVAKIWHNVYPLFFNSYLLDYKKMSMNVFQANLPYHNIKSFVLKLLVREGSLTVLTANWVVDWIVFWAMPSGILSRSASSFALTLTFQVLDLTPDTLISPEANNDTEE